MALDTTSPLLQFLLQGTGNNNNSWGQNLNDQVILLIEQAIAGTTSLTVTGAGDVTLTSDQSRSATIILGGTLTADQTIIVPATRKKWTFINGCTGNYFMLVKTASGTARNLPAGKFVDVLSDGRGALYRKDGHQVGEFFYHAGTTPPAGALECNGALPKRASAVDLYSVISTTWGVGDNVTTFGLPDGYTTGRFLRGRTAAIAVGVYQSNQNKSHTHTGSGTTSGFSNDHSHTGSGNTAGVSAAHSHGYTQTGNGPGPFPGGGGFGLSFTASSTGVESNDHVHFYSFTTSGSNSNHTHTYAFTTSVGSADGTESRPESMVGILCIRY